VTSTKISLAPAIQWQILEPVPISVYKCSDYQRLTANPPRDLRPVLRRTQTHSHKFISLQTYKFSWVCSVVLVSEIVYVFRHSGAPEREQTLLFIDIVHKFIRSKPLELVGEWPQINTEFLGFTVIFFMKKFLLWCLRELVKAIGNLCLGFYERNSLC